MDIKAIESALDYAKSSRGSGVARVSYIIPGKVFLEGKGGDKTSNLEEIELYLTGYPFTKNEIDDLKESLAMLDPPGKLEDYLDGYDVCGSAGIVTFTLRHLSVDYRHSRIINANNALHSYFEVPEKEMRPRDTDTEIVTFHREDSGAVYERHIEKTGFVVSTVKMMHHIAIPAEYIKSVLY